MNVSDQFLNMAYNTALRLAADIKRGEIQHERLLLEDIHGIGYLRWRYDFKNKNTAINQGAPRYDSKWIYPEVIHPCPSLGLDAMTEDQAEAFVQFCIEIQGQKQ